MTEPTRPRPRTRHVPPMIAKPNDVELRAARRAAAQHRRRRYPDTSVCGLCGWRWQLGATRTGKPSRGCFRRRQALEVLDAGGLLDTHGRPAPTQCS